MTTPIVSRVLMKPIKIHHSIIAMIAVSIDQTQKPKTL